MAETTKDLKELEEEQQKEDVAVTAMLEKQFKEFDKVCNANQHLTSFTTDKHRTSRSSGL